MKDIPSPEATIIIGLLSMGVVIENENLSEIRISVPEICDPIDSSERAINKDLSDSDYLNYQVKKQLTEIGYLNGRRLLSRIRKGERVTNEQYKFNFMKYITELR